MQITYLIPVQIGMSLAVTVLFPTIGNAVNVQLPNIGNTDIYRRKD